MRRLALYLTLAALVAGCGGKTSAPATVTTTRAAPVLSAEDRAACAELEGKIQIVSQLMSGSVDLMTESLHPKELARRTGETQRNLLYAARVLAAVPATPPLEPAQRRFVAVLRRFAADFGRAQRSVRRNDLARASEQLADREAVAELQRATASLERICRA